MTKQDAALSDRTDSHRGDSWWGYVKLAARGRVRREVNRRIRDDARLHLDDRQENLPAAMDIDPTLLGEALERLPPKERDVINGRFEGKSFEELGQELGITTERADSLWHRATRTWLLKPGWNADLEQWKERARYREKPWNTLLDGLCQDHRRIIDLVEQGRSPVQIALELKISQEQADKLWYGIGTTLLQAIDREDGQPEQCD
jgi:DNA-binding CsgD family transcriptional regulator